MSSCKTIAASLAAAAVAFGVASLFVVSTAQAAPPACCVKGNRCANGVCCALPGCCKADKSCCLPSGLCAASCGCPTNGCCSGSAKVGKASAKTAVKKANCCAPKSAAAKHR